LLLYESARRCTKNPVIFQTKWVGWQPLVVTFAYLPAKQDQQTITNKMINANKNQPAMFGSWLLERSKKLRHRSSLHHHK
jgi:hypothetical protein